ncbi:hydroxymethylbilane synthase [Candidatus Ichthyocystis hellenicum]|uniref:hydroxymethylbilane synthase n=1 Tax=Candidatus Ichthyocystis hellenicum TaxID=1561003 RepID=UPI000AF75FFE|nr:hydroxymethylbilane synthase [Candidatus Ichthyocystis hellenicum]
MSSSNCNLPPSFSIATRSSELALWQATSIRNHLLNFYPQLSIDLLPIKTQGDCIVDIDDWKRLASRGVFVRQLELAIMEGIAFCAVHSLKDVPYLLPEGLDLIWIGHRGDPSDAFVSYDYDSLDDVPSGGKIGTSSIRRSAQMKHYRPDLEIVPIRGNVLTRLKKMREFSFAGLILSSSGLTRLGLDQLIKQRLPLSVSIPAPGQGFLAIEARKEHKNLEIWSSLSNEDTILADTERRLGKLLGANCNIPLAAYASYEKSGIALHARLFSPDGTEMMEFSDVVSSRDEWQNLADRAVRYFQEGTFFTRNL